MFAGSKLAKLLLGAAILMASSPAAAFPLNGTLPKEQNIILTCAVGPDRYAKDCKTTSASPKSPPTQREVAFIGVETANPDYLAGSTPGEIVQVMVRRSLAAQLDGSNPGRAIAPSTPASQSILQPNWSTMPDRWSINGYMPERAERMGKSGSAVARCSVGSQGDLLGCWIAKESPSDWGFGYALLTVTTLLKMKASLGDGSASANRLYDLQATFAGSEVRLASGPMN